MQQTVKQKFLLYNFWSLKCIIIILCYFLCWFLFVKHLEISEDLASLYIFSTNANLNFMLPNIRCKFA